MSDELGLVDAHHHVWDLDRRPQPWLDEPGHEPIRRTFGTDDLRSAAPRPIAGRRLERTVVVQCVTSVPETRELLTLAEREPLIGAVVGWIDLTSPAVGDVLDELRAGPGGGYLSAVRPLVQDESDPEWLQQPSVEGALKTVGERGLVRTTYSSAVTGSTRPSGSPSASPTCRSFSTTRVNRPSPRANWSSGNRGCGA